MLFRSCMERLGVKLNAHSDFRLRLANHAKVKGRGICTEVPVSAFGIVCNINCHIMSAGLGAYPLILGRPWLRQVGAIQNWKRGTITVHTKKGKARKFNMSSRLEMEDEPKESSMDECTESDTDEESTTSEEEGQLSYLMNEEDEEEQTKEIHEVREESRLEDMDNLMQPLPPDAVKEELLQTMLNPSLKPIEKEEYMEVKIGRAHV